MKNLSTPVLTKGSIAIFICAAASLLSSCATPQQEPDLAPPAPTSKESEAARPLDLNNLCGGDGTGGIIEVRATEDGLDKTLLSGYECSGTDAVSPTFSLSIVYDPASGEIAKTYSDDYGDYSVVINTKDGTAAGYANYFDGGARENLAECAVARSTSLTSCRTVPMDSEFKENTVRSIKETAATIFGQSETVLIKVMDGTLRNDPANGLSVTLRNSQYTKTQLADSKNTMEAILSNRTSYVPLHANGTAAAPAPQ